MEFASPQPVHPTPNALSFFFQSTSISAVMKFASLTAAVLASTLPAFATLTVTYDQTYDDASLPLTAVACSNGVNGFISHGYTTLGSIPAFPFLGGVYTVTGWNSPECGTCYEVTYGDRTITVLAVDVAAEGFNLSEEAMNTLTRGLAVEFGTVVVTATQVPKSACGF